MTRQSKLMGLVAASALLMSASTASAQVVHMNTPTKVALFKAFTKGIAKTVAAGKPDSAKVGCLAAFWLVKKSLRIPRFIQRNRAMFVEYGKVCDPLYKNHKGDPAGYKAIVAQYKEKIAEYGAALAFPPFGKARTDSTGYLSAFDRYKRMVEAPLIADKARAYAVEFVGKLPNMAMLAKQTAFENQLQNLLEIMTGKQLAPNLIKTKAIPGIVKEVDKLVKAFRPTWHPERMTQETAKVNEWIRLLEQAAPNHPNINRYRAEMKKMQAAADKRWKAFVAKQRMPRDKFKGGGKAALIAKIKATYTASYKRTDKLLRVVITSESWSAPRGKGWWKGNAWHWSVFSKLSAVAAVEQRIKGKKTYKLFRIHMARERKGRGWTAPYMSAHATYMGPILKKNIRK